MSDFARQQSQFQRGILTDDESVLGEILDSPKEKRDVLFRVYKHAYGSRLVEAMASDHKLLHLYVGDDMFDEMGRAYISANPSRHPNLRWFSRGLPAFLTSTAPYRDYPILADLASLEKALNDAFDAADAPVVTLEHMATFAPDQWSGLMFKPHPSVYRLDATTNVAAIWRALKDDRMPPDAIVLERPSRLLIWRNDTTPMFRELTDEEAVMLDKAAGGTPFGELCDALATNGDPDDAAARGAAYLRGWVAAGLLTSVAAEA
jgi:hypothetical protein